ncbi:MAG: tetratricopeptide repeat protein [Planctomycetota bacterium]|nr:MAG: tetratricopeptide repeat protein [Planctomycetota bacterium]
MSYLLEILGRGLLAELAAAFRDTLVDDGLPTATLERAVRDHPQDTERLCRLGIRRLREQQHVRAKELFEKAIRIDPSHRAARIGLACVLDETGSTPEAVEHLRRLQEEDAEDPAVWFALGFCQEKLGRTEDAIVSYESVLDVEPRLRNAHERLAAIYLKLGNVEMAITHYEHLCFCEPDDLSLGLTLANLYFRAGRYDEAIREYERVITLEPDNWDARDELVTACIEAGRLQDAVEVLRALIERRPECADQYLHLGDVYMKMGEHGRAKEAYTKAVRLNPDYLEAVIKMGTSLLREGNYTEAADAFNRAIEINDRIVDAYCGLAVAQHARGEQAGAQATLEMAGEVEPNSTLLFGELSRLQLLVSAPQQVERYLAPSSVSARPEGPLDQELTRVLEQQADALRRLIRSRPNHPDLHYRLGLLLRQLGDLDGAIDCFFRAVSINPQYLKAMTKLALALRERGRIDEAIPVLKRALEADPESIELHYQLGLMFAERNTFALALDQFEQAARKAPQNPDVLANIALALQNMGLLDRAAATWKTLCEITRASLDLAPLPEQP